MQIKTITTVAGVNEIDFGNDDSQTTAHYYWFKNLSNSTLYVSAMPDPVAGEDNVAELSAKSAASVETDEGKVYVLGAGKVEIHRTNSKFCPFELPSTGSGGGGSGSITVDSELSETSENPLQNKATTAAINEVKSDLIKTQEDVAENAAALNTKSDVNHIHDITASGNPIILDGLQGGVPFSEITVSGKNLISTAQAKTLIGDNVNGYFVNDNASSRVFIQKLNPNTAYCIKKYDEGNRFRIVLFDNEPSTVPDKTAKQLVYRSDGNVTEYAFTTGTDYLWFVFASHFAESGDAVEPIAQLELGTAPTAYEPPITGRELTVNVSGKNLLNVYIPTKREYVVNNTTFTINDDGSVSAISTETEKTATRLSLSMTCLPGDYMFSGSTNNGFTAYIYNSTNNTVTAWANPNPVPCHIDKENEYVLYFMVGANCKANGDICKPQLETGSVATEYEPYNGADYTITPDSNPYIIPNDIRQQDGLNNISISEGELSVVGVQKNAAVKRIWDNMGMDLLFDGVTSADNPAVVDLANYKFIEIHHIMIANEKAYPSNIRLSLDNYLSSTSTIITQIHGSSINTIHTEEGMVSSLYAISAAGSNMNNTKIYGIK